MALSAGLTKDQRGFVFNRFYGDSVDIGAVELQPAELVVDTTHDLDDGDYSVGHFSLREALKLANSYATTDTITFASALTGQTIVLNSELLISDDVTIMGLGANQLTISGNNSSRILKVDDGNTQFTSTVEISGIRFTAGYAENGGAIYSLEDMKINECTFDYNHSTKNGGGIYHDLGELTVVNSTLAFNQAGDEATPSTSSGGGIYSKNVLTVFNSTITSNYATFGGGIYGFGGEALTVINSTIVLNTAYLTGGGLELPFSNTIIYNSIIAGNIKVFGNLSIDSQIRGIPEHVGYNIIKTSVNGLIDPELADNGGPTPTHALVPDSFAIDRGFNHYTTFMGLDSDQRGSDFSRVIQGTVDTGAIEFQGPFTQIELTIVNSRTSTDSNGEIMTLPENLDWIDEWSGYWLEIWISTSSVDTGISSATVYLNYNASITTATSIEFGAAFTDNQSGTINDVSGNIFHLSAGSTSTETADDKRVLFARIRFESTADDGVDLDLEGQSLNSQSPGFFIGQSEILFVGGIASKEIYAPLPTTQIWANPYDLNDDDAINFRDLILFASVYHTIPSESHSVYSWFADFDQNNRVNFRDLISFASNYGKSKANQSPVNYPQHYPYAWNQLLIVESQSEPQANAQSVTQSDAVTVLDSVVDQVSPQLTPSQNEILEQVDIEVVDLAGDTLGRAVPGTIYIDVNAAGRGWFVDASPADHSEFSYASDLTLVALPDSAAAGGVDLFTVILHELGHLLGYEHETEGVMQETLASGVRYLPDWADDSDQFFADLTEDTSLIAF